LRVIGGTRTKAEGTNFLSDIEYLSNTIPGPAIKGQDPEVAKIKIMPKTSHSVIQFKHEKPKPKEWKLQKSDMPGPGAYKEKEKAFNLTLPSSP